MSLAYDLTRTRAMRGLCHYFWPGRGDAPRQGRAARVDLAELRLGLPPLRDGADGARGRPGRGGGPARARVRGVEGLHVADASIMPTVPSANINLPTLMIGERFGEWLRDGAIG